METGETMLIPRILIGLIIVTMDQNHILTGQTIMMAGHTMTTMTTLTRTVTGKIMMTGGPMETGGIIMIIRGMTIMT